MMPRGGKSSGTCPYAHDGVAGVRERGGNGRDTISVICNHKNPCHEISVARARVRAIMLAFAPTATTVPLLPETRYKIRQGGGVGP